MDNRKNRNNESKDNVCYRALARIYMYSSGGVAKLSDMLGGKNIHRRLEKNLNKFGSLHSRLM